MIIKASFDTFSKGKKYLKIPLIIDADKAHDLLQHIGKFTGMPLIIDMKIDSKKVQQELTAITPDQRRKIFAMVRDYARYNAVHEEDARKDLTTEYCNQRQIPLFSLKTVTYETAFDFIRWLTVLSIDYGFINGSVAQYSPDVAAAVEISISKRVCIICSNPLEPADIHHIDAIGMGRNRNTYDDTGHRKIGLCRKHHVEVEQIGRTTFFTKYHLEELLQQ